jgi:hypothetical protein
MRLADVPHPSTAVAEQALEVCTAYSSTALLHHCRRSYIWAAAYAVEHGIEFDTELLFVSAMLHDIGLTPSFDNHAVPFEMAGGHVAWVFGAGAGWPIERRHRAAEIIVKHMWDEVDVDDDPESFLLEIATGLDISGGNPDWWPADLKVETVAAFPRLGLADEFTACFAAEAARKPQSTAASAMANGIAGRIAANTLDSEPGR